MIENHKPGTSAATFRQLLACHPKAYWGISLMERNHHQAVRTEALHQETLSFWLHPHH